MKIFIVLLTFISLSAMGQTKLKGTVTDAVSGTTLPLASLSVTDTINQKAIVFAEANEQGIFDLNLPEGFTQGLLRVSYLGYAGFSLPLFKDKLPSVLEIAMKPVNNQLAEIRINGRQKAITINGDKIVFNVEVSGIGDGNNGLETLRQVPGIKLDKDDNIQFRGNSDVQIMINGKKSLLQGDALREFIRSLKGSDIKSVEIIAQPSARYDAAGTAGIINIVLKKSRAGGFSGNVYSSSSYAEYFKSTNGGQLYYNDPLWNINANGYYYDGNSVNHREVHQTIQLEKGVRNFKQYNEWLPQTVSKSVNLWVERRLSDHHVISTEWQYNKSDDDENTFGTTYEYFNGVQTDQVKLTQHSANPSNRLTGNVFYNFTADSTATKLEVQLNYARYTTERNGFQRNDYDDASFMQLDGLNSTNYTIVNAQADISHKLSQKFSLETGLKYSDVKMKYYNDYTVDNASKLFIPDSLLTNDFAYNEKLGAGYAQLSLELEKWIFLAGLRAEYYTYNAVSKINNQVNSRSFTNWFPTFSASYKKENNQYQLSYSRRIGRPSYLALNPYYQYIDAYTLELGNPALKPQLFHSFQLSYIYKGALSISLYGYLYNKGFINVIDYLETQNYNLTYQANASNGNCFGISASLPYEPFDWWTMQLSLDAAYTYESSHIPSFRYSGSGFGYDISLYESFRLKNDWSLTLNVFYSGRATTSNGYGIATYDFSVAGKKYLLNKKLQMQAGCSNILKKSLYNQVTQVDNVTTNWTNRWETRRFYLQLTYYFGGGNNRKVKSASLDDEVNRM